ncbi:hypothetical protein H920_01392 [Fukomys damarensis]|uniref:Uncharacterized protein n=1 Tax=Fukomys damarensis TaxID=885580 RepID=A0A091E1N0_FUKDA|nr:hypothetical protein H920_01392 [Fukomys damarensis]
MTPTRLGTEKGKRNGWNQTAVSREDGRKTSVFYPLAASWTYNSDGGPFRAFNSTSSPQRDACRAVVHHRCPVTTSLEDDSLQHFLVHWGRSFCKCTSYETMYVEDTVSGYGYHPLISS